MHKINNLANLFSDYFVLSVYQIVLVLNKKVTDIFFVSLKKTKAAKSGAGSHDNHRSGSSSKPSVPLWTVCVTISRGNFV